METLIEDIVSGRRAAGEMLPREVDIAEQFEVGRGVARETIRALEERGVISVRHGKGATVTDAEQWNILDADVLRALLADDRGSATLAQFVDCRRILEVEAAAMAAERRHKRDLAAIGEALDGMKVAAALPASALAEERFHKADLAFHQALIGATDNRALLGLAERIHSALLLARYPLARPQYRVERALPEHQRIFDAVEAGDPAAAREAMNAHLDTIAGYLGEHRSSSKRTTKRKATSAAR